MAYVPITTTQDHPQLPNNVQKLLSSYNEGQAASESVKIYANLLKVNTRNKKQERLFILTNKAIYYLKPKAKSIRQRIALSDIAAITQSSKSCEFSLCIPSLFDYRFDAKNKQSQVQLVSTISDAILNLDQDVFLTTIDEESTSAWTITKNDLKDLKVHHDATVRTVFALDHLNAMGFKSKVAQKTLSQHDGNVSMTVVALLGQYVDALETNNNKAVRSLFISYSMMPLTEKISLYSQSVSISPSITSPNLLSPQQSLTDEVYEMAAFSLKI